MKYLLVLNLDTNFNSSVIECDSLTNPANGVVVVTGLTQGSTATYTCIGNYELIGEDTRTCDSNATWTNMEPICACK